MLTIYRNDAAPLRWQPGTKIPDAPPPVWLDLLDPDDAERETAARLLGMALPTREETGDLQLSSRLRLAGKALRMNMPTFVRDDHGAGAATPLAFVLTPDLLASVRYADSTAFERIAQSLAKPDAPSGAEEVFADLLDAIADADADRLQTITGDLSKLSRMVFADTRDHRHGLRGALFKLGAMQREANRIRSSQVGLARLLTYVCESPHSWMSAEVVAQLAITRKDVAALSEYDQQIGDRIQFVLDAVLGFINNDQNDIMKVLTIVSVVTTGPMILAGIWGMNFKNIHEYDWAWGYQMALAAMVVSVIVPLLIFRWKKWF